MAHPRALKQLAKRKGGVIFLMAASTYSAICRDPRTLPSGSDLQDTSLQFTLIAEECILLFTRTASHKIILNNSSLLRFQYELKSPTAYTGEGERKNKTKKQHHHTHSHQQNKQNHSIYLNFYFSLWGLKSHIQYRGKTNKINTRKIFQMQNIPHRFKIPYNIQYNEEN